MQSFHGMNTPGGLSAPPSFPDWGGGCVGVPQGRITACAFQLDVQWIIDAIERTQEMLKKVRDVVSKVLQVAQQILDKVAGILEWFCWIGGVKTAVEAVKKACALIDKAVGVIATIYDKIYEAMKHVLAPWEVRSAGEQIRDDLAPKCEDFATMLEDSNFKSKGSWTGDAAESFRASIARQQEAANQAATDAKDFGTKVQEIGAKGVETTITFVTELILAIIGIIQAVITMAAVPAGTAIGAAEIFGLVGAIITFVTVFITAMTQIIQQSSELGNAGSSVNGGRWPAITAG